MLSLEDEYLLRQKLFDLRQEHRDLDVAIEALRASPTGDEFMLSRLKKRKLLLKDMIQKISSQLIPDMNA
ncbi:YdcH family protein [Thiothrix eikelboomii]|uniref:YdcH family protein n=1 Tax=Thiothrix eikelboomii TaxID=92487 RepID=UPI003BAFC368